MKVIIVYCYRIIFGGTNSQIFQNQCKTLILLTSLFINKTCPFIVKTESTLICLHTIIFCHLVLQTNYTHL